MCVCVGVENETHSWHAMLYVYICAQPRTSTCHAAAAASAAVEQLLLLLLLALNITNCGAFVVLGVYGARNPRLMESKLVNLSLAQRAFLAKTKASIATIKLYKGPPVGIWLRLRRGIVSRSHTQVAQF